MTDQIERLTLKTEELRTQMIGLDKLAESLGTKLVTAFSSAVIHGGKLSDVLKGLALSLAQTALTQGLKPLGDLLGGVMGGIAGAKVTPFADGGIVNSPTLFPMRGTTGLMGEAGPEAIMPLARGSDGKLGVKGGGTVSVTVNIATPDAQSFQRSQSQVAALMARAVARGQRNL